MDRLRLGPGQGRLGGQIYDLPHDITIGNSTAGHNLAIYGTLGTELVTWSIAGWNEDGVTWTFAAATLTHVTGNTTAVTATLTAGVTAGVTYKVVIVGTGGGATATYTLGGTTGSTIPASGAISITDYITANATLAAGAAFVITPANTCTVAITSISIKALTNATGDLLTEGNLTVGSPATFNSTVLIPNGLVTEPSLAFSTAPTVGIYRVSASQIGVSGNLKVTALANASTGINLSCPLSPGTTVEEDYIMFTMNTAAGGGGNTKIGSYSVKWADATAATGYAVTRLNSAYQLASVQTDDIWLRGWGNNGVRVFGAEATPPGTGIFEVVGISSTSPNDNTAVPVAPTARLKFFGYNKSSIDNAVITLPLVTTSGFGIVIAGLKEEYTTFYVDNDGDVTLVGNSANVVANADTDAKLDIGTAATQEPLLIKNALGATKVINVMFWYD